MKRNLWKRLIGFALFCLVMGVVVWPNLPHNIVSANRVAQQQFKADRVAKFRQGRTLQQVQAAAAGAQIGNFDTRSFPDGSWVTIAWHSTHDSGGEWDGSVLRDSDGQLLWTSHHFCGAEGFAPEFAKIPAQSLKRFYKAVKFKVEPIT